MTNYFYIHIPFCRQKCPYCKFALTPVFDEAKKRRYLAHLKNEFTEYFQRYSYSNTHKTIYFGGGTPSILAIEEIREILECFPFYQKSETEITIECNPEDITQEYIEGVIELGINRISIGVQSLNNKTLTAIHRSNRESIFMTLESVYLLQDKHISLNVDFILGLPYAKPGETLDNIRELHTNFPNITHTSVYMLEDELYPKDWKENSLSEIELQKEFLDICEYFDSLGWHHYELSNFAKPGYESIHNQGYWDHSNSRGFGLSASSHENGKRWNNSSSFTRYYKKGIENSEILTEEQQEIERMMFGLRLNDWDTRKQSITTESKINHLIEQHLIEKRNHTISLTKTGIFMIDYIMGELV